MIAERRYIEYTVKEGDRLDLIAYKFWGDCNYAPLLVVDNHHMTIAEYTGLRIGEVIYVRENIDNEDIETLKNDALPFWKR